MRVKASVIMLTAGKNGMDDAAEEKVLKRSENLKVLRLRMLYEQKENY